MKIMEVCELDYMLKEEGGFGGKALGMTVAGWGHTERDIL